MFRKKYNLLLTGASVLLLGAPAIAAAQVINYPAGSTNTDPVILTANTQLNVSTGTATQEGVISQSGGARAVEKIGAGTLILTANNTYSGGTTISAGTLQIGNGSGTAALGAVVNNSVLVLTQAGTYRSLISGSGSVVIASSGTVRLSPLVDNHYSGGTIIQSGILQLSEYGGIGHGPVTMAGGQLNFYNVQVIGNDLVGGMVLASNHNWVVSGIPNNRISGGVSETGGPRDFEKFGSGSLTLSGPLTYTGTTIVHAGLLTVNSPLLGGIRVNGGSIALNAAPAGPVEIAANGRVDLNANATYANVISGAGVLFVQGNVLLTGESTHTGVITLGASRVLQVGSAATGSIASNITNRGTVVFSRSNSSTYSGAISDTGAVTIGGGGTLTLTGANVHTGLTSVAAGTTLRIGSGGTTGSIAGPIANAGALVFNRSDDVVHGGVISGAGGVEKLGGGLLTLSGANTYTGLTRVTAGRLLVSGQLASAVNVTSGGALSGTGTVGTVNLGAGAILSPGAGGVGVLSINGGLTMAGGSTLAVDLTPADADRVLVTGAASLNGTVAATYAAGTYVNKRYTLLTATGGRTGTFSGLNNSGLPLGFRGSLNYDAANAYLDVELQLNDYTGLNGNQQAVADSIRDYFDRTGTIDPKFGLLTEEQLSEVDGQAGGAAAVVSLGAVTQFTNTLFGRVAAGPGAVEVAGPAMAKGEPGWSVWGGYHGHSSELDGDPVMGSRTTNSHFATFLAGADRNLSDATSVGMALATGTLKFNVAGAGGGYGDADLVNAGVYVRRAFGDSYVAAAISYSTNDHTVNRTINVSGSDVLRSEFNTKAWAVQAEGGVRKQTSAGALTGYASVNAASVETPSYSESAVSGADTFALSYEPVDLSSLRAELGARLDHTYELSQGRSITLSGRGAAVFQESDQAVTTGFTALPGSTFLVSTAAADGVSGLLTVGASLGLGNGFNLGAFLEGQSGGGETASAGRITARYSW